MHIHDYQVSTLLQFILMTNVLWIVSEAARSQVARSPLCRHICNPISHDYCMTVVLRCL